MLRLPVFTCVTHLATIIALTASGTALGDNDRKFTASARLSFAHVSASTNTVWLEEYVKFPDGKKGLAPASNPGVVKEFVDWIKRILNSDVLPTAEFVETNILLIPAVEIPGALGASDVAFLRFRYDDGKEVHDILVSQTGGFGAAMYVAVCPTRETHVRALQTNRELIGEVRRWFLVPAIFSEDNFLARTNEAITVFSAQQTPAVAQISREESIRIMPFLGMKAYSTDTGNCFVFKKMDVETLKIARPPSPRMWFETRKKQDETEKKMRMIQKPDKKHDTSEPTTNRLFIEKVHSKKGDFARPEDRQAAINRFADEYLSRRKGASPETARTIEREGAEIAVSLAHLASEEQDMETRRTMLGKMNEIGAVAPARESDRSVSQTDRQKVDRLIKQMTVETGIEGAVPDPQSELSDMSVAALLYAAERVEQGTLLLQTRQAITKALANSENPALFKFFADIVQRAEDEKLTRFAVRGLERILESTQSDERPR